MSQPALTLELVQRIADACPMGVFVTSLDDPEDDRTLRIVYANGTIEKLTGVPVTEIIGRLSEEAFPSLRERGFIEQFIRVMRTGVGESYEDTYYADERVAAAFAGWVERIGPNLLAVWFENVTRRREIEAEAARAESLAFESKQRGELLSQLEAAHMKAQDALDTFEIVADAAEEALWEMTFDDPDAPITPKTPVRFSNRFAELVGIPPAEIQHELGTFERVVHPEDIEHGRKMFFDLVRDPSARLAMEYRIVRPSGEVRHVHESARGRANAQGRPRKIAGAIRDVTDKRRTEFELRERLAIIERQQSLIEELSSPILDVWDGVIALPVVGTLDGRRAEVAMQELLREIAEKGVRFALLDLTGVESIDAGTAEHVVRIAQAVGLLGARAIITGIQPGVAQAIVELGLELSAIETRRSLRDGLRECLQILARERRPQR
jgi:PAS domain S-box-containing protein